MTTSSPAQMHCQTSHHLSNAYVTEPSVCPYLLKGPKPHHKNKWLTSDPRQTCVRVPESKMAFSPNFLLFCLHLFPPLVTLFHITSLFPCSLLTSLSDALRGFDHTCLCTVTPWDSSASGSNGFVWGLLKSHLTLWFLAGLSTSQFGPPWPVFPWYNKTS